MDISIIIPAHNEEQYIRKCLSSIINAKKTINAEIEIIVVLNRCTDLTEKIAIDHGALTVREDSKNLSKIRNAGAKIAKGDIIVTLDADSQCSENMLFEIKKKINTGKYIGGGVFVKPDKMTFGIFATAIFVILPALIKNGISAGSIWCLKKDFNSIGGFNENYVSAEDVEFAKRLKEYGKKQGKKFTTLKKAYIITSTRKFDLFGHWYLIKNRKLVKEIFSGKNQEAANHFYYDARK